MASLNSCEFIGNLGADPEIKNLPSGGKVANFSIACTERWKDKQSGEQKERTEWVRIAVFNDQLVKVIGDYLKKGSQVYIRGKMQTRKWQDQSGADKYSTEIVMDGFDSKLVMLGGKPDGERRDQGDTRREEPRRDPPRQSNTAPAFTGPSDDIPF